MSRTYRRIDFNKKTKASRMRRYWQMYSEQDVQSFYEKCLGDKEDGRGFYQASSPYRYHGDNYHSKNNKRKQVFLRVYQKKLRQSSKVNIKKFMDGMSEDVVYFEGKANILRIID